MLQKRLDLERFSSGEHRAMQVDVMLAHGRRIATTEASQVPRVHG